MTLSASIWRSQFSLDDAVIVLAYRHDGGISDLRGSITELGERFATVTLDADANPRGLGIVSVDVSYDRLETWDRPVTLKIGDRVRLRHAVDRYPHFLVDAGALGTVVHTPAGDPSGTLCVRMDEHVAGAEDWENEIVWSVGDGDDPMRDLEVVS